MNQITEDYVSYEIAKLLKEKGFDVPCHCFYEYKKKLYHDMDEHFPDGMKNSDHDKENNKGISAPTQSLALKWLREEHKINIVIGVASDDDNLYSLWKFDIWNGNYSIIWGDKREKFNSYEEAVEAALKYTLENLI